MSFPDNFCPEPAYALFSGGKDSFACAKALELAGQLLGCVGLETGIATPDWKETVIALCAKQGWPIEFFHTSDSYERIVRKFGFPGAGQHGMFMNYLKGRAVRRFKAAHKGATLASGVRKAESARRALSTKPISYFEGVKIIAPVYEFTTDEVWEFVRAHGYERPMAYSTIQISGDCLCGAFAAPDEREAIDHWYPDVAARIKALEADCVGKEARATWGWNNRRKRPKQTAICVECVK